MVVFNPAKREIGAKIVYYGPAAGGKTTNLQLIHSKLNPNQRGDLVSLATKDDRTLFFDFLPLDLGTVKGFKVRFHLYTVPGQVYYVSTRRAVLTGVDGVVFVADSQEEKMAENIESLEDLEKNLHYYGKKIEEIPLILQYNKRDLENLSTIKELSEKINKRNLTHVEAVAVNGKGVMETLTLISKTVLGNLEDSSKKPKPAKPVFQAPPKPGPKPVPPEAPSPIIAEPLIELEAEEKIFDIEKLRAERRATIDKLLKQREPGEVSKEPMEFAPPPKAAERVGIEKTIELGETESFEEGFKEEETGAEVEMPEEPLEFGETEEGVAIGAEVPSELGKAGEEIQLEEEAVPLELEDSQELIELEAGEEALKPSGVEELEYPKEEVHPEILKSPSEPEIDAKEIVTGPVKAPRKVEGIKIVSFGEPEKILPGSIKLPLILRLTDSNKEAKITITIHLEELIY